MMPFSILRTWFLGFLGWGIFGAGAYFLYEWSNGVTAPEQVAIDGNGRGEIGVDERGPRAVIVQADRQGGTSYLWGGLALLLLATGGGWPVWRSLMSSTSGKRPLTSTASRSQRLLRGDGSELAVEHFGPADAPVLLFTHGWSLDRSDWEEARVVLGERYHLVFWDLAGLGQSTAPRTADHSLEKMAADLEAVLTEATAGPCLLIGHSIGGMIQQTFCRMFPQHLNDRVRGLVFVHTTYTNPTKTAVGAALLTALQKPVLEPLTYLSIWMSPLMWLSNWQSYWNGSLHLSARLTSFSGKQTWQQVDHLCQLQAKASPAVVGRGSLAMTRLDEQAALRNVPVPTLVVAGMCDRLTKPDASRVLAQLLPDSQLVTLAGGHFGHWEQSSDFHEALSTFADSVFGVASELVSHQTSPLHASQR